jgi:hypothetical protein
MRVMKVKNHSLEIYSTTAKLKGDQFSLQMGMKCNIETLIGNKPESKFDINKIILKSITKIPKQITANIIAVSATMMLLR